MKGNKRIISIVALATFFFSIVSFLIPKRAFASTTSICAVDCKTGIVLEEQNADAKKPMASTTKIMTAITVIERAGELDEKFFVPKSAVGIEGSSVYLKEGESVSIRELLYCLMLRSGNDAAVALSIIIAGSEKNFVGMMNEKAAALGATNTHFENPHGLHSANHYTTAEDLAKIAAYAMRNEIFKDIVSTKEYVGERGTYRNKNKMLFSFDGANGIKTGYTTASGRCLASSAERNGNTVVCVVLDCPSMYETSAKTIDDCFEKFSFVKIWKKGEIAKIPINGIPRLSCSCGIYDDVVVPVKKGEEEDLRTNITLCKALEFPVKKNEEVGQIEVLYKNKLLFSQKIYTMENVGTDKLIFS